MRRSAGQWAAFALAQAIAIICWRRRPVWLAVVAGVRFSDLFTDLSYILAVRTLTGLGWMVLLPPPLFNPVGGVIMLMGFGQAAESHRLQIRPRPRSSWIGPELVSIRMGGWTHQLEGGRRSRDTATIAPDGACPR